MSKPNRPLGVFLLVMAATLIIFGFGEMIAWFVSLKK